MLKLWPKEVDSTTVLLSCLWGGALWWEPEPMQLQQAQCSAEEHVPPACVVWSLRKHRRREDLVLRTVKGSCGDHGLLEAQGWVEVSKPWC